MNDRFLSLIGLCRRAGKISIGHDACMASIISGRAKLCLICSDASERLKREFERAAAYDGRSLNLIHIDYTMSDIEKIIGFRAGVFTVEEEGFSKKFIELVSDKSE